MNASAVSPWTSVTKQTLSWISPATVGPGLTTRRRVELRIRRGERVLEPVDVAAELRRRLALLIAEVDAVPVRRVVVVARPTEEVQVVVAVLRVEQVSGISPRCRCATRRTKPTSVSIWVTASCRPAGSGMYGRVTSVGNQKCTVAGLSAVKPASARSCLAASGSYTSGVTPWRTASYQPLDGGRKSSATEPRPP